MNHNPKNQWSKEQAREMNKRAQWKIYEKQKKRLGLNKEYLIALHDVFISICIGYWIGVLLVNIF